MIYKTENYELLSIKEIYDFHGQLVRHDLYMRIIALDKINYIQLNKKMLQYISQGYIKKIEVTSGDNKRIFILPEDSGNLDKWADKNPNYSVKRITTNDMVDTELYSLENFIKVADRIYDDTDIFLIEKPSEFKGEENYINDARRIY